MIKFFRKIRQRMINESRFSKYMLYAIGEIFLVVIGILIAVSINSRYNEAANEKKIEAILTQVQHELLTDIKDSHRIFNFYIEKDSLSRKIMNDAVTAEMYKDNPDNLIITRTYVSFSNKRGGYERLLNNLENLPERFKSLLPLFNSLYVELQNDVDDYNTEIKETVTRLADERMASNPRMVDYIREKHLDEAAAFFLDDPFLKNKTATFMNDVSNIASIANDYRSESIRLYNQIDSLLGRAENEQPDLIATSPGSEALVDYMGTYTRVGGTMEFDHLELSYGLVDGQLNFHLPDTPAIHLLWHDDLYFFEEGNIGIYRFYINEEGQHAMEISDGLANLLYILTSDI